MQNNQANQTFLGPNCYQFGSYANAPHFATMPPQILPQYTNNIPQNQLFPFLVNASQQNYGLYPFIPQMQSQLYSSSCYGQLMPMTPQNNYLQNFPATNIFQQELTKPAIQYFAKIFPEPHLPQQSQELISMQEQLYQKALNQTQNCNATQNEGKKLENPVKNMCSEKVVLQTDKKIQEPVLSKLEQKNSRKKQKIFRFVDKNNKIVQISNIVKNLISAFLRFIKNPKMQEEITRNLSLEQQNVEQSLLKAEQLIQRRRCNNLVVRDILAHAEISPLMIYFLQRHSLKWIEDSKIQDKDVYKQVVEKYLQVGQQECQEDNVYVCRPGRRQRKK